jgi:YesN/AraC family two-component response regulator
MIQCFVNHEFTSCFESELPVLVSASKIDADYTEHPRMLHSHKNMAELLLVRSGSSVYIVDEKRYDIKPGDLIICNAGVLHDEDPQCCQDLNTYSIAMTNVHLKGLPQNTLIPADVCPVIPTKELFSNFEQLMGSIYTLLASEVQDIEEICHYLTASLTSMIYRLLTVNVAPKSVIPTSDKSTGELLTARIKQYIDLHYDEGLTLQSIGDALHVNMYYLSHVFKDNTGYAPMQYIMRRRIGEAQSLLISTKDSITQIAGMVGYDNPCHFNTIFAKYVGMSPSKYRKSYTKSNEKAEKSTKTKRKSSGE